jgi:DNA-binding LytR/AlgR family response regulator
MTINCAIIDDEPLAAEMLASYAAKTPFLNLVGVYNSAVEAIRTLRSEPVDLLFLDIQMPELSGLEFATILPPETLIIFTTAFDRYAIDSYKVNTVDYLLKPIAYENFLKAADKALRRIVDSRKQATYAADRFIYVKSDYKLVRIDLDDIMYIEGVKDYVRIVLANSSQPVMCLMNMRTLEEYLPTPEFLRVHRSYIVHMSKVQSIDRFRFVFGDTYIPISESYKDVVNDYLNMHTLN